MTTPASALGFLAGTSVALAEDTSTRIRAATLAGLPDFHGNPFPDVIDPPPPPPTREIDDDDAIKLPTFKVNTTRPPPEPNPSSTENPQWS